MWPARYACSTTDPCEVSSHYINGFSDAITRDSKPFFTPFTQPLVSLVDTPEC